MALDLHLEVLTAVQVAEILQCSPKHVNELKNRGVLRAIPHTGRMSRFSRRAVEEFINGAGQPESEAS